MDLQSSGKWDNKTICVYVYTHCCCSVIKLCLTLLGLHGLQPSRFLCPWDFPGKNTPGGLPGLGIEPMSPALAGEFFTREPLGKTICPHTTYINAPKAEKRKNHNRDEGEVYKVYQGRPIRAEHSLGTWSQVKRGQREQSGKRTWAGGLLGPFGEWLGQQVVGTEFVAEKESGGKKATVTCTCAHPWTFYT